MEGSLFVRQSSGLVRNISRHDAFIGNLLIINLVITSLQVIVMPWLFPGINLPLSVLLTVPPVLLAGIVYLLFGLTMPRSGGDYVYISRTLHPALGMAANFSVVAWNMSWMGAYANWVSTQGLAGVFYITGTLFGSEALKALGDRFASPGVAILVGTAVNVALALVLASGLSRALRVQRWLFYVAFAGLTVAVLLTAASSHERFLAAVSRILDPQAIADASRASGFTAPPHWNDLRQTFYGTGLNALALLFMWFVQYAGGEIRDVRRSLPFAVLGSFAFGALYIVVMAWAAAKTFGYEFMADVNQVFYAAADEYPLKVPPTYQLFASVLTDSAAVVVLIGLAFICWPMAAIIMNHLANSRCMFAWSFDRVLPEQLARVSERTHSPVVAILLSTLGAEAFLIFYTYYSNAVAFFGGSTLGYMLAFGTTALAGLLFPWTRREWFERSPAGVRVLGVPLIQLAALGTLAYFAAMFWAFLTNPAFGVVRLSVVAFVAYWVAGLLIYLVSWLVRRQQGIDIALVYRHIPAE